MKLYGKEGRKFIRYYLALKGPFAFSSWIMASYVIIWITKGLFTVLLGKSTIKGTIMGDNDYEGMR